MDSAARNFLALAAIATVILVEGVCGLLAYVLLPLAGGSHPLSLICLGPAMMLGGLLGASIWVGTRTARRQVSASQRLACQVRALARPANPAVRSGAEAAGLVGRVDLLEAEEGFSFVYGLLRPRVAISSGLVDRLTASELRAAMEHERYHVRSRDPLRSIIGVVLTEGLFVLPWLSLLQRRYEAGRELAADERAEQACGRRSLIGALLKALDEPEWSEPAVSVPLASADLLSMRLSRLETGQAPRLSTPGPRDVASTISGLGVLMGFLAAAILGVGGIPALGHAIAEELRPADLAFEAVCLLPALAIIGALTFASAGERD